MKKTAKQTKKSVCWANARFSISDAWALSLSHLFEVCSGSVPLHVTPVSVPPEALISCWELIWIKDTARGLLGPGLQQVRAASRSEHISIHPSKIKFTHWPIQSQGDIVSEAGAFTFFFKENRLCSWDNMVEEMVLAEEHFAAPSRLSQSLSVADLNQCWTCTHPGPDGMRDCEWGERSLRGPMYV